MSDAVRATCRDLKDNLPSEVRQDSNAIRARFCYLERTSEALQDHLATITTLYTEFSAGTPENFSTEIASSRLMSLDEFL
eukprot:1681110-Prymnesium_polylepis.1